MFVFINLCYFIAKYFIFFSQLIYINKLISTWWFLIIDDHVHDRDRPWSFMTVEPIFIFIRLAIASCEFVCIFPLLCISISLLSFGTKENQTLIGNRFFRKKREQRTMNRHQKVTYCNHFRQHCNINSWATALTQEPLYRC